jgi:hypothetical protein
MKRSWQMPQLERVGNLAELVSSVKISGNVDAATGDPTHTHKNV